MPVGQNNHMTQVTSVKNCSKSFNGSNNKKSYYLLSFIDQWLCRCSTKYLCLLIHLLSLWFHEVYIHYHWLPLQMRKHWHHDITSSLSPGKEVHNRNPYWCDRSHDGSTAMKKFWAVKNHKWRILITCKSNRNSVSKWQGSSHRAGLHEQDEILWKGNF